jgi:hypothetical protein
LTSKFVVSQPGKLVPCNSVNHIIVDFGFWVINYVLMLTRELWVYRKSTLDIKNCAVPLRHWKLTNTFFNTSKIGSRLGIRQREMDKSLVNFFSLVIKC